MNLSRLSNWTLFPALMLSLVEGRASADSRVDQEQRVIDAAVGGVVLGGASQQKLAQVVTTGMSGMLTTVRVPVECSSGDLLLEIQGVSSGLPDGIVLTSEVVPGANLPPFFPSPLSFRSLVLSKPVSLDSGTPFAIVFETTGDCGIFQGPMGNPYSGGDGYFDSRLNPPGVWARLLDRIDLPFQTLVDAAPFTSLSFQIRLRLGPSPRDDSFVARAYITLSPESDGVDPPTESVTLRLGRYSFAIPPGHFREVGRGGSFVFEGEVNGANLTVGIRRRGRRGFVFGAVATGADLLGLDFPMEVGLAIGDDGGTVLLGTATVSARSE